MHARTRFQAVRPAILTVLALFAVAPATAEVRLPRIFGSHMVLQRDLPVPVWGWAAPGEQVTVTLGEQSQRATAGAEGRWSVQLAPLAAGGPHRLVVAGENTIELDDVLIGEVWLCSGQSNMEWGIRSIDPTGAEVAAANFPSIRLFRAPHKTAIEAQTDVDGAWQRCSPETIGTGGPWNIGFSAVAYYFGRELHRELDVPVGLVLSAWGGTRIEPWTPLAGLKAMPSLADVVQGVQEATPKHLQAVGEAVTAYEAWVPQARAALEAGEVPAAPPAWPTHPLDNPEGPTALYNGMIHPLVPFAVRGVIWYQGESNHPDGMLYRDKMEALIKGWRQVWGRDDMPFYYVQLAPYGLIYSGEQLPRIWEAQTAALAIPHTGMAVTVDIGDVENIHPQNKLDVGKRLALWALARTYGRDVVYSGPLYKGMAIEGERIRVRFEHTAGGLAARDGQPLTWFTIAGQDRKFVPAEAVIDGETVVVHSPQVARPVAVRFAWHQNATPNLMNKAGLPASPFRTDDWDEPKAPRAEGQ